MKRTFQIYRYDPDKDAKPYSRRRSSWTATSACCSTPWSSFKAVDPTLSFRRSAAKASVGRTP